MFVFGTALAVTELRKIVAPDAAVNNWLGVSIAISGNTMLVGAPGASSSAGAAYIFAKDQGGADNWGFVKKLTPATDAANPAFFGQSVALDGDIAIVGAPGDALADTTGAGTVAGSAYLYSRDLGGAENWGLLRRLVASDYNTYDHFGSSVAIQGTTVAVGAPGSDLTDTPESGAVYIFRQNSGGTNGYAEVKKLTASDATTYADFGRSIAVLDADRILIGAPLVNAAYLFAKDQGGTDNYGELKKLTSTDAQPGDNFGSAVAFTSTTLLIGAPDKGAAYIFAKDQGGADNYGQVVKLTGSDASGTSGFGRTVALSSTYALVGAYGATPSDIQGAGAAYVFEQNTGGADAWGEVNQFTASDAAADAYFGWSVSASNFLAAIGAMHTTTDGLTQSGASYVFNLECAAGQYNSGSGCTAVEAGYYSPDWDSNRYACSNGQYQDLTGQSSCKTTSAGTYTLNDGLPHVSATPCAVGTYQNLTGQTSCNTPTAGYWASPTNNGTANTAQTQCTAGYYCSGGVKTAASAGYYVAGAGATSQTACGIGTYQASTAQSSCTAATAGYYASPTNGGTANTAQTQCTAGYYCSGGVKTAASAGYYVAGAGATSQTACGIGTYQTSTAQSSCTAATAGYYASPTNGGTGNTAQTQCTAGGYYCTGGVRYAVGAGNYTNTNGGAGASTYYQCTAGYYCTGNGARTACASGYSAAGSTASSQCYVAYNNPQRTSWGTTATVRCDAGSAQQYCAEVGKTFHTYTCYNNGVYDSGQWWTSILWNAGLNRWDPVQTHHYPTIITLICR